MAARVIALGLLLAAVLSAQPKRVLYITHSAGFVHGSIPTSIAVLRAVAARSGALELIASEDLSLISAERLSQYDAVLFFTSGELPLTDQQKADLLAFVRSGKGFGGVHSATDTLYQWPEYGELIGAWFDGHPWVQRVRIDVEDPEHPISRATAPSWEIMDEIYQHRSFSRDRVRVLMSLDPTSVDLNAPGVNRSDNDFALAWVRPYGSGRSFYTALGHFDETWRDQRFQSMMLEAMLWLTGLSEGDAAPRPPAQPLIFADGVTNAASGQPAGTISPGSLVSIYGGNLTFGSSMSARAGQPATRLAGAMVRINGQIAPVFYASPGQINALAPASLSGSPCRRPTGQCVQVDVLIPGMAAASDLAALAERTPAIFTVTIENDVAILWTTGLGAVRQSGRLQETIWRPRVLVNDIAAEVLYSGLAPGWPGLYQINVALPPEAINAPRREFRILD
jgi:uncharacterized protein (TIGR03437 family)